MLRIDRLAIVGVLLATGIVLPLVLAQQPPITVAPAVQTNAAIVAYREAVALYDQKDYAAAQKQVILAISLDPELPDAQLLKARVDAELARAGARAAGPGQQYVSPPEQLLTQEQINRIRVFELGDSELKGIHGSIVGADLEDFWKNIILKDQNETATSAQDHIRFTAPINFSMQVSKIREERAVTYFDKVKLNTDPADIRGFKTHLQPYILQNCATSGCHGGEGAAVFRLYGNPTGLTAVNDRETYTNLLVLSTFTAAGHNLIDRAEPDQSLVLQYLLPRKDAAALHPRINDKDIDVHRLAGTTDQHYREIVDWAKSLAYPQPNYQIQYKIVAKPKATAATSTAPATRPK